MFTLLRMFLHLSWQLPHLSSCPIPPLNRIPIGKTGDLIFLPSSSITHPTTGDAFMCVGGTPHPCHPRDAAIRVARMAADMVAFAQTFEHCGHKIQIRSGPIMHAVTVGAAHDACTLSICTALLLVMVSCQRMVVCTRYGPPCHLIRDVCVCVCVYVDCVCRVGMHTGNVTTCVVGHKMPHFTLIGKPLGGHAPLTRCLTSCGLCFRDVYMPEVP